MKRIDITELKNSLNKVGIEIEDITEERNGCLYVDIKDSNINWLRFAIEYNDKQKNHCVNIYQGEHGDTKNGYWWDYELNYDELANDLLQYHNK
jgi:hypothetical protein